MAGEMSQSADFLASYRGSVATLIPLTPEAEAWIVENLSLEPWQRIGDGYAIEPRYLEAIAQGIENDGLTLAISS